MNVIIYHDTDSEDYESPADFNQAANEISNTLKPHTNMNKIRLINTAVYPGDWLDVADLHFNDADYNWILRFWGSNFPRLGFQNNSTNIDFSLEGHFRYCKESTIKFANNPESQLSKDREYWL